MRRLALALALAALLAPPPARAFTFIYGEMCPEGAGWPASHLPGPWWVHEAGYSKLPFDTVLAELTKGIDQWGLPCCSYFRHEYRGSTAAGATTDDDRNVVEFLEASWPEELGAENSVIAVTMPRATSGCRIVASDMVFNGVGFAFRADGESVDLWSIATHEFGHWVGLGHTEAPGASMRPYYSGNTRERDLAPDDLEGACSLYPKPCTRCAGDHECFDGQRCTAGDCVPWTCESHDDCGDGRFCSEAGDCRAGCRLTADCPRDHLCRDGACVRPTGACMICEPCALDEDCRGEGRLCLVVEGRGICTAPCESDADCEANAACRDLPGDAGPVRGCAAPGDDAAPACPADWLCREDPPGCSGLWDLCNASGTSCDPDTDTCVATGSVRHCTCTCTADADCGEGNRCVADGATGANVCFPDWVVDPCARVTCVEGDECVDGACVPIPPCRDVVCADDESCEEGACLPLDPCRDVACDGGQVCSEGSCVDPCTLLACGEGFTCRAGACWPVGSCDAVVCPDGFRCEDGLCREPPPEKKKDDGGCAAAPGGAVPGLAFALAALLLGRRRRRSRGAAPGGPVP